MIRVSRINTLTFSLASRSFLISLSILRSLLSECKQDIALFAPSVVKILRQALDLADKPSSPTRGVDLEIAVRAVSVVRRHSWNVYRVDRLNANHVIHSSPRSLPTPMERLLLPMIAQCPPTSRSLKPWRLWQ
jgi:hypothetical protein